MLKVYAKKIEYTYEMNVVMVARYEHMYMVTFTLTTLIVLSFSTLPLQKSYDFHVQAI